MRPRAGIRSGGTDKEIAETAMRAETAVRAEIVVRIETVVRAGSGRYLDALQEELKWFFLTRIQ
jgi:hypothetical protein